MVPNGAGLIGAIWLQLLLYTYIHIYTYIYIYICMYVCVCEEGKITLIYIYIYLATLCSSWMFKKLTILKLGNFNTKQERSSCLL